ncbi:putative 2-C-methyl-D-erythritol 4-phosphate cytidylyltransferase [Fannyhessea vaginae PB189-T1-4]|uniref:2-C-methyl-D-erythritol 4-phosphate cytidylyltransferase n=1 Tax=Fannyhessea vaginae PB189-T1-4 TaxID=866774 RepID=A0ABN0B197_9ACTN|nr:IspD/TarI family cytidylyltransferase [Fannyhessea vaginae]EFL44552.1 putative 2-C-methyl-D-erythritol 4-phosphate cytidylyltransferase [Fannyhessea vaginae PB189-T1-4]
MTHVEMPQVEAPAPHVPARPLPQPTQPDTCAIIAAGGVGKRFGNPNGKQYASICGKPVVYWSIRAMAHTPSVACIVVAVSQEKYDETCALVDALTCEIEAEIAAASAHEMPAPAVPAAPAPATPAVRTYACPIAVCLAQDTRQNTVAAALSFAHKKFMDNPQYHISFVAIHDGARPLIRSCDAERAISTLRDHPSYAGTLCAHRVTDTLKQVDSTRVVATPDRSLFWCAQTPQVFAVDVISAAHMRARDDGFTGSDDVSLVEYLALVSHMNAYVHVVESPRDNIKITLPEDLAMAQALMSERLCAQRSS